MPRNNPSLMLEQRLVKRANTGLHCSETSLRLSEDERELILSRYIELYRPEGVEWVERSHRVSVTALLRWIVAQGEALPVEQGQELPKRQAMN